MKQGWKTCKFADVFDLQMGKTPSRDNPTYWGDDNMWVSIADMNEQKYMSATKEGITDVAVQESGIKPIPKGTVIMSFKLSIGKVSIATSKLYTNEAIMGFIEKEEGTLVPEYLYYYLKGYKWEGANKAAMGMTLNKKTIAENTISYPPVAEQEKIVAELDCLSGIIEKKKQQLKELDNLAQSIFYDMFGDPVENDKGWDVSPLKDVCLKITDGTHNSPKSYSAGAYMYITAKNIKKDGFDMSNITYVPEDIHRSIYNRCNPVFGDILYIKDGATTGIAMLNSMTEEFSLLSSVALLKCDKKQVSNVFIRDVLNFPSMCKAIRESMGGAAITRLTLKKIEIIKTLMPPIALQQEYASKIESIEKQKELIAKSIKETETLFNSRMDYYFN